MLEIKDIEKLAKLARIQLTDEEKARLAKEVDPILGYIAQLKEVISSDTEREVPAHRNIMREDTNPHISGECTEVIVANMPDSKDNYLKVKKII